MGVFRYVAKDENGKRVDGELEAVGVQDVAAKLRLRGLWPLEIEEGGKRAKSRCVKVLDFTRNLKGLLEGGVSLEKALRMLIALESEPRMRLFLEELLESIRSGKKLSEAMKSFESDLPGLYLPMLRVGEAIGDLPKVLGLLLQYLETVQRIKEHLFSSLVYPSALMAVGLASLLVMLTYVVPRFSLVFREMGQAPPLLLSRLELMGSFIREFGPWFALGLLGFLLALKFIPVRGPRVFFRRLILYNRLVGRAVFKIELLQFCRALGTMILSGVPLLEALEVGKGVFGHEGMRRRIDSLKDDVKKGISLSLCFAQAPFPRELSVILSVSEQKGDLGSGFISFSAALEEEIQKALRRFLALLEPAIVVALAVMVGSMVMVMFKAITSIHEIRI